MIKVDFEKLNPLEKKIHATLSQYSKQLDTIRITKAAELCGCSVSKISKFTSKLGFETYKQYLEFLYGRDTGSSRKSGELERIGNFLDHFDHALVEEMAQLILKHEKLVLMGYGPSYLCSQYFEYRFMTCTNKVAISTSDDVLARSISDENSLLLIFTTTGNFKSFEEIYKTTKAKGGDVAFVLEEFNSALLKQFDRVFCLSRDAQSSELAPYEKTRTLFFIFMEEVIQELMRLS